MPDALLDVIETYYDAVPRTVARAENIGPFTLFVNAGPGWPYYARPALGARQFSVPEVQAVRARQRELEIPESFEWVDETSPELVSAVEGSGLSVSRHPLMVLEESTDWTGPGEVAVRLVTLEDDLPLLSAIAGVAFGQRGTAIGTASLDAARQAAKRDPIELALRQERLRLGRSVMAVAAIDGEPVGVGNHIPLNGVTEIVGVGVLPAYRRRGTAGALTRCLVADARERGIQIIFLSAGDNAVARIYGRIGFRTIATACIAEPA